MSRHRFSQLSLYYLAAYLLGGGIGLASMPTLALQLLMSNGDYGEIMPRTVGFLMLALGVLVVQFIRLEIHSLYNTAIAVRLGLCAGIVWLYTLSGDPLFLTLLAIVGLGVILTGAGKLFDGRAQRQR